MSTPETTTPRILEVTVRMEVTNPQALQGFAFERLVEQGVDPEEAIKSLSDDRDPSGVDLGECLRNLVDPGAADWPGTQVLDSFTTETTAPDAVASPAP